MKEEIICDSCKEYSELLFPIKYYVKDMWLCKNCFHFFADQ